MLYMLKIQAQDNVILFDLFTRIIVLASFPLFTDISFTSCTSLFATNSITPISSLSPVNISSMCAYKQNTNTRKRIQDRTIYIIYNNVSIAKTQPNIIWNRKIWNIKGVSYTKLYRYVIAAKADDNTNVSMHFSQWKLPWNLYDVCVCDEIDKFKLNGISVPMLLWTVSRK